MVVVFWGSASQASAQANRPERLVDYVPSSLLSAPTQAPTDLTRSAESQRRSWAKDLSSLPLSRSAAIGWARFEREYGIQHRSASQVLSAVQTAKYGLDSMIFGAQAAIKQLELTYDFGSATGPSGETVVPRYSMPVIGTFGHAQLKSVFTVHDPQTGAVFFGLKLHIPFGNSG
jgi:hypothetical protein